MLGLKSFEDRVSKMNKNNIYKLAVNLTQVRKATTLLKERKLFRRELVNPMLKDLGELDKGDLLAARLGPTTINHKVMDRNLIGMGLTSKDLPLKGYKDGIYIKGSSFKYLNKSWERLRDQKILSKEIFKENPALLEHSMKLQPYMNKAQFKKNLDVSPAKNLPKLNPKNKEMTNRIIMLHEGAETEKTKFPNMYYSHISPKVILRESNLIGTMPKSYAPAKKFMTSIRALNESPQIESMFPGWKYGQRISRHAMKNMERQMGIRVKKMMKDAPAIVEEMTRSLMEKS